MAITAAQQKALAELYVAILDRAPAIEGFNHWAGVLTEVGGDLTETATRMWNSAGAQAEYGPALTVEQTVTKVFNNVFNRDPAPAGLAHWVSVWNDLGPGQTMLNMISNINTNTSTDAQFLLDKALFQNKVEFGLWFALEYGEQDPELAKSASESITSDPASVDAAIDSILNPLDESETIILKAGTDLVETGNNDDEIKGTESTLNTSDEIDGGEGYDVLELDIDSDSADFVGAPTIDNIELITVTQGGSQGLYGSLDLSDGDFNDTITLEVNENEELEWTWEDIQNVNNTSLRVIDTDEGVLNVDYDTNAYAGNDTADLTVAEVDCLTVNFWNETDDNDWSDVDQVDLHSLPNGQVNTTISNYMFALNVGSSFKTLMIDGTANLTIEQVLNDVNSVTKVDASGLTANLNFDIQGQGAVTGVVGTAGAARVAPITIIGAQGNDDISVDTGSASGRNGVNGTYSTGTGNDSLKIGDFVDGFDGEDCHAANNDTLDCPENVWGDSTVSTGTGNDTVVISLHGEQNIDTADGNDNVTVMGDTDDILTTIPGDGISTITTGAGNDRVTTESDYSNYVISLGDGADTLSMDACEDECAVGDVSVSAGTGNDWMDIAVVDGYHTVDAGEGDDTLAIGCECDDNLGELSITMGAGNDDLFIYGISYNTGSDSDIDVDITLGAGDDYLSWQGATLSGTGSAAISLANALSIDAGTGNDFLSFTGDHRFDLTMGSDAGNDTLELVAEHLESQDSIDMGDGIDTIILRNGAGADVCDFGEGCGPLEVVRTSETTNTSSVEIFDLRNGNIELHLTTGLFQTAQDSDITVRTELSERTPLPTITYEGNDPQAIRALSEGMTREDWESVVEDWQAGLYVEAGAGFATFDLAQADLMDYILDNGVTAIDFDDTNNLGLDDELVTESNFYDPGNIDDDGVTSDDEDQVFFRVEDCEQTIDVTEVDFSVVPDWQFTLLGGNVRDVIIANDDFISGNFVLRFDSNGSDAESVTDTLVVRGGADITDMDEEQISGLECIILQSTDQIADRWEIDLTEQFVSQTTGNADLEILVDTNVEEGSKLYLTTDNIGSPTNGVKVHINSNVTLYINGVVATPGQYGVITVVNQLLFTDNNDQLIGTGGNDTFVAANADHVGAGDVADGNGGTDTLLLEFGVFNDEEDLEDQLDEPQISEIEIIKFVVPEAGLKADEGERTYLDISMEGVGIDDVEELWTGFGDDTLLDMEAGIHYYVGGGNDYVELAWAGGSGDADFYIHGGEGSDTVNGSNNDDDIHVGGVEVVEGDDGDDDIIFDQSGDGDASGNDGTTYVFGGEATDANDASYEDSDAVYLDDNGTNGTVYTFDIESVFGGDGSDTIVSDADNNDIYIFGDDDDSDSSGSADDITVDDAYTAYVDGEEGNDIIRVGAVQSVVAGAESSLTDYATVYGGSGADTITVVVDDDAYVDGESGNDLIDVWTEDYAEVWGGSGADTIEVLTDDGDIYVDGGDDADLITVDAGGEDSEGSFDDNVDATVYGGDGDDTIYVDMDDEAYIYGGSGDDDITVNTEDGEVSEITGGSGDDSIQLLVDEDGGQDNLIFGTIEYNSLQQVVEDSQGVDEIWGFNFEAPGGAGAEDRLDFSAFLDNSATDVDESDEDFNGGAAGNGGVAYGDWTGTGTVGNASKVDLDDPTPTLDRGVAVIAADEGFVLNASHITALDSTLVPGAPMGIEVDDNGRAVVLIAMDTDGNGGFDTADVYFVQDLDSDFDGSDPLVSTNQFWKVDHVATIHFATEIGAIESIEQFFDDQTFIY